MDLSKSVLVDVDGSVAVMRLNRPAVLNALTPAVMAQLLGSTRMLSDDPTVSGLVITGEGRGFCSGADIEYQSVATHSEYRDFIQQIQELTRVIRTSDLVVVAAINGVAMGGGLELALACDRRVAAPGVTMGFPEVKLGLTVTSGVNHILPRLIGPSRALDLLISGRSVSADDALASGLVDAIESDVIGKATEIASASGGAVAGALMRIRTALYFGCEQSLEATLELEKALILESFGEAVTQDKLRGFLTRPRGVRDEESAVR